MKPKLHSTSFSELFILACSYFLSYFQSVINEISAQPRKLVSSLSSVLEISCCSIFNERFALRKSPALAEALVYYTKFESVCQGFFENFFNFFIFARKRQEDSLNYHNFTIINAEFRSTIITEHGKASRKVHRLAAR